MKRTLFVSNVSFRSRALLVLLLAFTLVAGGCDSSGDDSGASESSTVSPDVLDVDISFSQGREGGNVLLSVYGTNNSDRTLSYVSVSVRLWDETTQIENKTAGTSGLTPGTAFEDELVLIDVDDPSEIECYTYRVAVEPLLSSGNSGTTSSKVYPGSCSEDHPANG